jgi:hypothetical protein
MGAVEKSLRISCKVPPRFREGVSGDQVHEHETLSPSRRPPGRRDPSSPPRGGHHHPAPNRSGREPERHRDPRRHRLQHRPAHHPISGTAKAPRCPTRPAARWSSTTSNSTRPANTTSSSTTPMTSRSSPPRPPSRWIRRSSRLPKAGDCHRPRTVAFLNLVGLRRRRPS